MKQIWIDIDNTICTQEADYSKAIPFPERIEKYNALYDLGHNITYWTARGMVSGIDWGELTEKQLKKWGVKYHFLKMGKPAYDLLICDKTENPNC
jgi:hypothetical protein